MVLTYICDIKQASLFSGSGMTVLLGISLGYVSKSFQFCGSQETLYHSIIEI